MREIYFWRAEGSWVCEIPRLDDREMEAAEETARHTKNTWQKNRGFREILKNTVQGRLQASPCPFTISFGRME